MPKATCRIGDCQKPASGRGLCQKHYMRERRSSYGDRSTLERRFWTKVDRSGGPDACWLWMASVNIKGYGRFETVGAHRVAYELATGPIPPGTHIDHLCRVRLCVNPAHLEAVTPVENMYRGMSYQGQNHRKTHCKRGHEFTPSNTYLIARPSGRTSRSCKACARTRGLAWWRQQQRMGT